MDFGRWLQIPGLAIRTPMVVLEEAAIVQEDGQIDAITCTPVLAGRLSNPNPYNPSISKKKPQTVLNLRLPSLPKPLDLPPNERMGLGQWSRV